MNAAWGRKAKENEGKNGEIFACKLEARDFKYYLNNKITERFRNVFFLLYLWMPLFLSESIFSAFFFPFWSEKCFVSQARGQWYFQWNFRDWLCVCCVNGRELFRKGNLMSHKFIPRLKACLSLFGISAEAKVFCCRNFLWNFQAEKVELIFSPLFAWEGIKL